MPGPRKPPDQRQRRNTPDIGNVQAITSVAPDAPQRADGKPILAAVRAAWVEFWDSDLSGLVLPADMPAMVRLFRMYDSRERMERAYLDAPFSTGSTGQVVIHPAAKEVASLDGRITALEDRFGITPMGRLKLGVTFGAAAKSLEAINADFDSDSHEEEPDPRVIEISGRSAS